jgi:hypothetical protein
VNRLVGVLVSILVGLALAAGVTYSVTSTADPDSKIDLRTAVTPDSWAGVPYGAP